MEIITETLHINHAIGKKVEKLDSSFTVGGNIKYNDPLEK